MSKEAFIAAHEELIDEFMEAWDDAHPDATVEEWRIAEAKAYDLTADAAYERMRDNLADAIDWSMEFAADEREQRKAIISRERKI